MFKLVVLKDYIKVSKLSESGVRKSIKSGNIDSIEYKDNTYVILPDKDTETIKDLKNKIRIIRQEKKTVEEKINKFINQEELIKELREEKKELKQELNELKNEFNQEKTLIREDYKEQKDLLKNLIGHYTQIENKKD